MDERTTSMTPANESDIVDLLQRQATLFDRLTACAARQRAMIENDRVDPLLTLLAERKKITTELMGLSNALAPVRARWGAFCAGLKDAERSRVGALMDRARGSLKELVALDEEDGRLLRAKKAATSEALASVRGGVGAMNAYRSAGSQSHRLDAVHQES